MWCSYKQYVWGWVLTGIAEDKQLVMERGMWEKEEYSFSRKWIKPFMVTIGELMILT